MSGYAPREIAEFWEQRKDKFGDLDRGVGSRLGFPRTEPWGHISGYLGCALPRGAAGDPHERSISGGCFGGESAPTSGCRNQQRWYQPAGGAGVIKGARLHTMQGHDSPYLSSPRCEGPWGRGEEQGWVVGAAGLGAGTPTRPYAGETSPGKY